MRVYDGDMADLEQLRKDLAVEHGDLDLIVSTLDESAWRTPTPAEGWDVRDQVAHLAFFDDQALLAVSDPDGFAEKLAEIAADVGKFMDESIGKGRSMSGQEVLSWWRSSRAEMLNAFEDVDPGRRIAWYGPPMKPASFISARVMETWAHAQDVADAFAIRREATTNLKHIAHLGVLARGFSYSSNQLDPPTEPIAVELEGPTGEKWIWQEGADQSVRGDAFDFCLVATQRRHLDDTDLEINGPDAERWMSIAQTYAGPPGSGRLPGQFAKRSAE
jgi:uncharacterized protein (TIGR03084 family)